MGVHRLVVRMAAFQAVDMGSNPVERIAPLILFESIRCILSRTIRPR